MFTKMSSPSVILLISFFFFTFTFPVLAQDENVDPCDLCKNGFCYEGGCSCRFSWAGKNCDEYIFESIPGIFIFFRVFFAVVFALLLLLTLAITWHAIKEKFAYYHLVGFLLIAFDGLVQVATYASSVETIEGIPAAYITGMLTVVHFALIYFTYSVYLLWWVELNDKYKRIKRGMTRVTSASSHSSGSKSSYTSKNHSSQSQQISSNSYDTREDADDNIASSTTVVVDGTSIKLEIISPSTSQNPLTKTDSVSSVTNQDLESGTTKGEEREAEKGEVDPEKEKKGIMKLWHKIAPEGVSATKLRWTLWTVCIVVNITNLIRIGLFDANISGMVGLSLYISASVVGWIIIIIGFDLYKRAFLRKLKNSHKTEVTFLK